MIARWHMELDTIHSLIWPMGSYNAIQCRITDCRFEIDRLERIKKRFGTRCTRCGARKVG